MMWLQTLFYSHLSNELSPEIKLSSCLCFINANIILLLFIKFQVAADETMTGGESDSGDSFLTLQLVLCILIRAVRWKTSLQKLSGKEHYIVALYAQANQGNTKGESKVIGKLIVNLSLLSSSFSGGPWVPAVRLGHRHPGRHFPGDPEGLLCQVLQSGCQL